MCLIIVKENIISKNSTIGTRALLYFNTEAKQSCGTAVTKTYQVHDKSDSDTQNSPKWTLYTSIFEAITAINIDLFKIINMQEYKRYLIYGQQIISPIRTTKLQIMYY